jgi:hypothetical protein
MYDSPPVAEANEAATPWISSKAAHRRGDRTPAAKPRGKAQEQRSTSSPGGTI